jgi:hypothetical protein
MSEMPLDQGPLFEADKEFCFGLYRYAVARYQPMIEKRIGVSLGTIAVRDYRQLHDDMLRAMEIRTCVPCLWVVLWPLFCYRRRRISRFLRNQLYESQEKHTACYFWNGIYVSFQNGTRSHEEMVARNVVHELSHAVWEKLGGIFRTRRKCINPVLRLFVEGFATYAELIWFVDFYPPLLRCITMGDAKVRRRTPGPHGEGLKLVERLVKENGVGILPDLPKQWRKYAIVEVRRRDGELRQ